MVKWSDKLDTLEEVYECCVLNEDISFRNLSGYVIYSLCMLEIIKVNNEALNDTINMFKERIIQYTNYDILDGENEESYISRVINLEKIEAYKVDMYFTTTDKVEQNSENRKIVVTLTEDDTDYLVQLKRVLYGMNINSERKNIETFNGKQSEYYNCHIEVVNSFKILLYALEHFLNSYSLKNDTYKYFDKVEIDNKLDYSDCIFKSMERRLEYLLDIK